MRKRHVIGTVSLDIYEEFSFEMKGRKETLLAQLEKLDQKLSNPKELIHFTCKLGSNLVPVWDSGNYYQNQMFQNVLFPQRLAYDVKIEHYRTPVVNSAIAYIADLSKGLAETKNGNSHPLVENFRLVDPTSKISNSLLQDFKILSDLRTYLLAA